MLMAWHNCLPIAMVASFKPKQMIRELSSS